MDYNMKQWRYHQQQQQQQQQQGDDESAAATPAKIPRLFFDSQIIKEQEEEEDDDEKNKNAGKTECSVSPQLHLFVPTDDDKLATNSLSAYPYYHSTSRLPKMGEGGSYFSYGQWQELELQALIYRHMLAGAAIPPQLLLMLHKSLFDTAPPPATTNHLSSSYYLPPLQHYSHYHPALLQSGYWGKGAMDPEPGRCRRTDGKKWRCSRDVVGGQKYCERHVHRGRNRSRKPVEHPATTTPLSTLGGGNSVACSNSNTTGLASSQVTQGVSVHFDLTGPSAYMDQFQHAQRPSGPQTENKITSEIEEVNGNLKPSGQALRHFFDDWSNRSSDSSGSSASLSISTSTSGNMPSDFSLKLTTGNGNESGDGERTRSSWGGAGWGSTNQVAPMGGPLAEALRSSRGSNTSPTCVLNLVK